MMLSRNEQINVLLWNQNHFMEFLFNPLKQRKNVGISWSNISFFQVALIILIIGSFLLQ